MDRSDKDTVPEIVADMDVIIKDSATGYFRKGIVLQSILHNNNIEKVGDSITVIFREPENSTNICGLVFDVPGSIALSRVLGSVQIEYDPRVTTRFYDLASDDEIALYNTCDFLLNKYGL